MQELSVAARREQAVEAALAVLTLEEKVSLLAGRDMWSLPPVERIGLRSLVMADGPVGVRSPGGPGGSPGTEASTAFPSPSGQAASWDVGLVRRIGRLIAQEARAKGVHMLLAPTLNLHRTPLGGRHFENFSEDPLLTGRIGAAFIGGVQDGGVAATPKHYVANESETQRLGYDVQLDEKVLREQYLVPFETAVKEAGAWAMMAAYNSVLGCTMTEHVRLQHGVLKGEWGFDGAVVSDWGACRDTDRAAMGGTDIAMPGGEHAFGAALVAAVRQGRVPELDVDGQVRRVLRLAARTGLLEGAEPAVPAVLLPAAQNGGALAREAAVRSFVLLRNEPVGTDPALPLTPAKTGRIALIGAGAARPRIMGGGSAEVTAPYVVTPLDGLRAALPDEVELVHEPGVGPGGTLPAASGDAWSGLHAVFRGKRGVELYREELTEAGLRHVFAKPAGLPAARVQQVEIHGEFTPDTDGEHTFSACGLGTLEVRVDDKELFTGHLSPVHDDPLAAVLLPPEARGSVQLTAGVPVRVSLVQRVCADVHEMAVGAFRLGHAGPGPDDEELISRAAFAAATSDVAVVVVSTTEETESEGVDRTGLDLPGRQDDLVARVVEANPHTVVVVNSGSPVHMPWREQAAAVLLAWFPGQEFGTALADVLLGAEEPGGRLPTTWPVRQEDCPVLATEPAAGILAYDEGLFTGYRGWEALPAGNPAPAYWFGHGLGYTDWTYEHIEVAPSSDPDCAGVATVRLLNSGRRAGREVVQLYAVSECAECIESDRPARQLAAFTVVEAGPGERVEVSVPIPMRAVQGWDRRRGGRHRLPGRHRVEAGRSVADLRLRCPLLGAL
ncbi:glycoside hydrolase family 3 C-terminal domain-containing protein [Streptomyces monticola]|uniref:Glycoside hydrolase family 3 C-terminal domain-containing protein n=1 Tax=Streptomyces monticola TaxID=2666263 RepID=A0ABW2JUX3_9ACTN